MMDVLKKNKDLLKDIAIAVGVAVIVLQFIKPTIVYGSSMEPTLNNHDYLILSKQAYLIEEPKFGDIVVCDTGGRIEEHFIIKRIIGLPGDRVEIKEGLVLVNDALIDEEYVKQYGISGNYDAVIVPEGYYYVLGDNRQVSKDSRSTEVGCIDKKDIVGKAVLRLYPLSKIGVVK